MTEILKRRASGRAEIRDQKLKPFNQQAEGPTLYNLELFEDFHGEIEGENQARSLVTMRSDGSGSLVGIARVVGKVGEKSGSFVLQASATFVNKHGEAKWFVVPDSGTGELANIRGDGGFTTEQGEPSEIWLDYWFEE
ncbi:MAG TPA: DUF3224 domain-containing protein [Nitrososphaerales archaeon]|nr:DUF3224 domain-containing protein [Nitrososphaerales archaeon]